MRLVAHATTRPAGFLLALSAALALGFVAVGVYLVVGPRGSTSHNERAAGAVAAEASHGHLTTTAKHRLERRIANSAPQVDPAMTGVPNVSTATAQKSVSFDLKVPDSPDANKQNMTGAYVVTESVEMHYPPPDDSSSDLNQPFISVWEAPWTEGDPLKTYQEDIAADPGAGSKSVCAAGDLPALCVEPRSPADATQSNPAFVRVVIDGVEVEISGGDSVKALLGIANSLTTTADGPNSSGQ